MPKGRRRLTLNQRVAGSNPATPTNIINDLGRFWDRHSSQSGFSVHFRSAEKTRAAVASAARGGVTTADADALTETTRPPLCDVLAGLTGPVAMSGLGKGSAFGVIRRSATRSPGISTWPRTGASSASHCCRGRHAGRFDSGARRGPWWSEHRRLHRLLDCDFAPTPAELARARQTKADRFFFFEKRRRMPPTTVGSMRPDAVGPPRRKGSKAANPQARGRTAS
jgi:hypothetical protein